MRHAKVSQNSAKHKKFIPETSQSSVPSRHQFHVTFLFVCLFPSALESFAYMEKMVRSIYSKVRLINSSATRDADVQFYVLIWSRKKKIWHSVESFSRLAALKLKR